MWGTKSASYNLCVFDLGEQIVNSNECCDEVVKIKTRSEGGRWWQNFLCGKSWW